MRLESYISQAEDKLSEFAMIPFVGILPATAKFGMGSVQTVSGLACTLIFSPLTYFNSEYKDLRDRSISHIVHGMANMTAAVIEGIPFVGFILLITVRPYKIAYKIPEISEVDRIMENSPHIALQNSNPIMEAISSSYDSKRTRNYILISPNSFKFLGYKALQNYPHTYYYEQNALKELRSSPNKALDQKSIVKLSDKDNFKKENPRARFCDPNWGPVYYI